MVRSMVSLLSLSPSFSYPSLFLSIVAPLSISPSVSISYSTHLYLARNSQTAVAGLCPSCHALNFLIDRR
jgi:hypothetical protein